MSSNGQPAVPQVTISTVIVKVVATLVNPDETWEDERSLQVTPDKSKRDIADFLFEFYFGLGGFTKDDGDYVVKIPWFRLRDLRFSFPRVTIESTMPTVVPGPKLLV